MAFYYNEPSRTFHEYLLIPGLSTKDCVPEKISLKTPLVKFSKGEKPPMEINIPVTSAVMQAVSDSKMAIALARAGGISFIFMSQSIEEQAEMVRKVKKFKAGFVVSDSNLKKDQTLKDVLDLKESTGHSTIAITEDGSSNGRLEGIVTSRDFRLSRTPLTTRIESFMTPFASLIMAREGITLEEANNMIWENKLNCLPVVDDEGHLVSMVFRKDYDSHRQYPNELQDDNKQLLVGAGINTRDYKDRVPALIDAGADILCIDSSDGYSEWQAETIAYIREEYGDRVKIGAGNVVDKEGFLYLANAGADFVKVGIGGGSICITREQKGIGRGQASAIMEVAAARKEYFEETGIYIPLCSDGGIVHDHHITLALAMGADFVMLGRYFARFEESPGKKLFLNGNLVKEYWGEGSNRARNWQRYDSGSDHAMTKLEFEEGVDSYIPYAGRLKDNLNVTILKIKSTLGNCGVKNIPELQKNAKITLVSSTSIVEGSAHDVIIRENDRR